MIDPRHEILEIIRQDEDVLRRFLDDPRPLAKRTHAFLGNKSRWIPPADRLFDRYGKKGEIPGPCILTQVFRERYRSMDSPCQSPSLSEQHPWYECCGVDCTFLRAPRKSDGRYPIEWEFDWMIEVENNVSEFAYHLRGLLDFVCNHRLGIFFSDSPDEEIAGLNEKFRAAWRPFAAKHRFADELDLQVVFFPNKCESSETYSRDSRSYTWNAKSEALAPS